MRDHHQPAFEPAQAELSVGGDRRAVHERSNRIGQKGPYNKITWRRSAKWPEPIKRTALCLGIPLRVEAKGESGEQRQEAGHRHRRQVAGHLRQAGAGRGGGGGRRAAGVCAGCWSCRCCSSCRSWEYPVVSVEPVVVVPIVSVLLIVPVVAPVAVGCGVAVLLLLSGRRALGRAVLLVGAVLRHALLSVRARGSASTCWSGPASSPGKHRGRGVQRALREEQRGPSTIARTAVVKVRRFISSSSPGIVSLPEATRWGTLPLHTCRGFRGDLGAFETCQRAGAEIPLPPPLLHGKIQFATSMPH